MVNINYDISVIIPTHNRADILEKGLVALTTQTMASETFEIIVCDDGSEDQTRAVVEKMAEKADCSIRYLFQPSLGANASRNKGVAIAKGRLLLFINDDTIATPDMLRQHKISHDKYPEENIAVLGNITISPEFALYFFTAMHLDSAYDQWRNETELDWRAFFTCNVSVKRSYLLKYGLFDEQMIAFQDVELSERLSHYMLKVIYNPDAFGFHYHYIDEAGFLNAAIKYGKAMTCWYLKSPHLKEVLVPFGLHLTCNPVKRTYFILGDMLINRYTRPLLLKLARWAIHKNKSLAKFLYWKIYGSLRRKTINEELKVALSGQVANPRPRQ